MLKWLLRRLGLSDGDGSAEVEYDPIYGLSRRALNDWLKWNPQLAAEHELLERAVLKRRHKAAAHQEPPLLPAITNKYQNGGTAVVRADVSGPARPTPPVAASPETVAASDLRDLGPDSSVDEGRWSDDGGVSLMACGNDNFVQKQSLTGT